MTDFRFHDNVRLAGVDPSMPDYIRELLGEIGTIRSPLDRKGLIGVEFARRHIGWPDARIPAALLENLTLAADPRRERPTVVGRAGLPGFEGMLVLRHMGGLKFRAIDARDKEWGRLHWKRKTGFQETARYAVSLDGRELGEVWRATGSSYMAERHVWLADTALAEDVLASEVNGVVDDHRTTRISAGINVAGVALHAFDFEGAKLAPLSVIQGYEGRFEKGCYLVDHPDAADHRLWLTWEDPDHARNREPGYTVSCQVRGPMGWEWASYRDPDGWEIPLTRAMHTLAGVDPEFDTGPGPGF